ncbi:MULTISPECIES: hypothetical protein, partial [Proteiniclasticum]|uniref:hypothetical protein n=1 Tax=Proteiniclasticum TaxID=1155385 RepID=UPI00289C750C
MRNYIVYKCPECGTEFAIHKDFVNSTRNYITCPIYGKHKKIIVIGAYDDLEECMKHPKYRRGPNGSIRQD